MEEKAQNAFLFFLLVFPFVYIASSYPYHLEYEGIETDPESSKTLSLPLHHIDDLFFRKTPEQLFHLRLQRDAARVRAFNKTRPNVPGSGSNFTSPVFSGLPKGSGEYYTRIGIGTPPRYVSLVIDTGSDIIWLQCKPCKNCYDQTDPIFDPEKSTSFAGISCNSSLCKWLDELGGCNEKNQCQYKVTYNDNSTTTGDLSIETLTFGKTRLKNVAFGCSHDNKGSFVGIDGLLGFGGGRLSFPSQTGTRFNKRFSYCLVDRFHSRKPSSIIFGDSAISRTTRFTPLLKNPQFDAFYYVELLGISVGGIPVRGISPSFFRLKRDGNGGVIIDSGTTVTRLTSLAYFPFRNAFRVATAHLKRVPKFELFDTCYDLSRLAEAKVPTVVLHFRDVDVSLLAENIMFPVKTNRSRAFCFAFSQYQGPLSIIGNIQQQGIRVVYDLVGSRVGFSPGECL